MRNKVQAFPLSRTEPTLTNDSSSLTQVTLTGCQILFFSGPVQNNVHDDNTSNKEMAGKLNFLGQAQYKNLSLCFSMTGRLITNDFIECLSQIFNYLKQ